MLTQESIYISSSVETKYAKKKYFPQTSFCHKLVVIIQVVNKLDIHILELMLSWINKKPNEKT